MPLRHMLIIGAVTLLVACGSSSPTSDPPPPGQQWCDAEHTHTCSVDEACLATGGCASLGQDGTPQCRPVTCQSYEDWAIYGHGGECPGDCAAACTAHCAEETALEQEVLAEAAEAGCPLPCMY